MTLKDSYLRERFEAVEESLQKASNWGAADAELGAYLAGYLVVLICGVYEDCVEYLINRRASTSGDSQLTSYVYERTRRTLRNPDSAKVRGALRHFSETYREDFKRRVDSRSTDALDSIVENKNWLAHGETSKLQVTVADVDGYFRGSLPVFQVLEDIL